MSKENISENNEAEEVEDSLKDFIEKLIGYYEIFKIDSKEIKKYETLLNKSDTLLEVFDIMKNMFNNLMDNIISNKSHDLDCSELSSKSKHKESIEQIFFNYQLEIKNHIKIESQLRDIIVEKEKIITKIESKNQKLIYTLNSYGNETNIKRNNTKKHLKQNTHYLNYNFNNIRDIKDKLNIKNKNKFNNSLNIMGSKNILKKSRINLDNRKIINTSKNKSYLLNNTNNLKSLSQNKNNRDKINYSKPKIDTNYDSNKQNVKFFDDKAGNKISKLLNINNYF